MGTRLLEEALAAAAGRPSLNAVILATLALFWLVLFMAAYLLALRAWHRVRRDYRERRAALYRPAVELVLMEEPYEAVLRALRPRRFGDGDIAQEVLTEAIRYLEGPPFEILRRAALDLGFVESNLKALRSWDRHRRGRAMERLGALRATQAIVGILSILDREPLEMKLVALRALAAIGRPEVLPYFLGAAKDMPPGLLPRMASLMLEFGAPGRGTVFQLVNLRPKAFPPPAVRQLLQELRPDWEVKA